MPHTHPFPPPHTHTHTHTHTHSLPYASFSDFDKIDSFPKPFLDIFIHRNLIVGGESVRRGLVFCIRSIDLGEVLIVGGSRIHKNKSWYYLGPFETFKIELSTNIVFDYKPSTFL